MVLFVQTLAKRKLGCTQRRDFRPEFQFINPGHPVRVNLGGCTGIGEETLAYLEAAKQLETLDLFFCLRSTDEGQSAGHSNLT
jgi:hypothetical protein